jgi:hypothetical protein
MEFTMTKPVQTLLALIALAIAPSITAAEPATQPDDRQMLSRHDTVAEFDGTRQHTCQGLTARCPDKCGHSGTLAVFTIRQYLKYEKPGEYGDPQQKEFMVMVKDNMGHAKIPQAMADKIGSLQKGDLVRLVWQHDYVTQGGSKFPERTITTLEKITPQEPDIR